MSFSYSQIAFLRNLAARGAIEKGASASAEFFLTQHGLGLRAGSRFVYSKEDAERAAQMLVNRRIAAVSPEKTLRRIDAVLNIAGSEKSGTLSPHYDSVAIKTAHGRCLLDANSVPQIGYQVLTHEQSVSVRADALMVVENLESFRFLERNRWLDYLGKDVLAIFRGDNGLRADAALKVIEARKEPVWAYFDFDPAGLGMASRLPRLERLLLPCEGSLETSARQANQVRLFADQTMQWSPTLDADSREIIRTPWRHMQRLRLGLAQEYMDALES
ncbi:hypothetical protein [Hydrogenophaga sp. PAMC20947]|uniref:DUF7281 domain-containing protein n=1 Tax=Hydrogenophaga sp. PAMC20947 TaxID=2565558 RepID=UPI00109E31EE|nr:hypothetical protein [Hydrogenophaga sp. PAMC20947]QCB46942.1 hypothetical protein E5678_13475 [Hydrogenophaga sp. PAMC20947]